MVNIYLLDFPANFKPEGDLQKVEVLTNLEIKEDDVFIGFNFSSPLAIRLKYYLIPSENLVINAKSKKDLSDLIKKEKDNFRDDYQIFSGAKLNTGKENIIKDVETNIKLLFDIAIEMLEAGYLAEENRKKIKDWILSFEEPVLKIFAFYHKVETSNPSISLEEEFLINCQFRKTILIMLLKILANYIINNELYEVEEVSNWLEEKTWYDIKKKIKLFK